jgi:mannosyltransferase
LATTRNASVEFAMKIIENKKTLLILLGIFILGATLRIYGLGTQSLWNDELASWDISNQATTGKVLTEVIQNDIHPPLYYILLYYTIQLFDSSETALRLLSVIFGIAAIPLIFLLGKLLYSRKEGIVAAGLLAVLWCPIYYSQEARSYSMLLFLSIFAMFSWFKLNVFEQSNMRYKRNYTLVYAVTGILMSYLHYFGLLLIVVQGMSALVLSIITKRNFKRTILTYLVIGLTFVPWLAITLSQIGNGVSSHMAVPHWNFWFYFLGFLFNKSIAVMFMASCLYLFWFIRYSKQVFTKGNSNNIKTLIDTVLLIHFIFPFILGFAISQFVTPILTWRNLIVSLPAAYLLISRSWVMLVHNIRFKNVYKIGFALVLLFHLIYGIEYYNKPQKQQFSAAVEYIVNNESTYHSALVLGYAWSPKYFNYYFEKFSSKTRLDIILGEYSDIDTTRAIISQKNTEYFWYITAHRKPNPDYLYFLTKNFDTVAKKEFVEANVWLFKRKLLNGSKNLALNEAL